MRRREFATALAGAVAAARAGHAGQSPDLTPSGSIIDVLGLKVGHFTDARRPTGCTAIIFDGAREPHGRVDIDDPVLRSTTLVVVATNVAYSKTELTKIAMMANAGGAWTIRPYVPVSVTGALAAEVVAEAIVRGVRAAKSVDGWPAAADLG